MQLRSHAATQPRQMPQGNAAHGSTASQQHTQHTHTHARAHHTLPHTAIHPPQSDQVPPICRSTGLRGTDHNADQTTTHRPAEGVPTGREGAPWSRPPKPTSMPWRRPRLGARLSSMSGLAPHSRPWRRPRLGARLSSMSGLTPHSRPHRGRMEEREGEAGPSDATIVQEYQQRCTARGETGKGPGIRTRPLAPPGSDALWPPSTPSYAEEKCDRHTPDTLQGGRASRALVSARDCKVHIALSSGARTTVVTLRRNGCRTTGRPR